MKRGKNMKQRSHLAGLGMAGLLLLVAGPLMSPVGAHVTDSLDHLKNHLDGSYVKQGVITRQMTCPGFDFYPHNNTVPYANEGPTRVGGPGHFRCGLSLPVGSTVKDVGVAVGDTSGTGDVGPCTLNVVRIRPSNQATIGDMAVMARTGDTDGSPGTLTLKDLTIADVYKKINRSHAYWVECPISNNSDGTDGVLGIIGAYVTYSIQKAG